MHLTVRFMVATGFFGLALGGCATPVREYDGPDAGVVVVSVESEEEHLNPWLFFHRQGGTEATPVTVDTAAPAPGKYRDGAALGIVRSFRLPPGAYEIDAFQYNYSGTTIGSRTPRFAPIPFVVAAGQLTYAGSYAMRLHVARPAQVKTQGNVTTVPDKAVDFIIQPQDRLVRDVEVAAGADPRIVGMPVRAAPPASRAEMRFRMQ